MHCWSYNNGHLFTIFLCEGRLCADVFVNDSCSFFRYFPRAIDYASTPANVDLSEEDSNVGHQSRPPAKQRRFASRYYRSDRARRTSESQNGLPCHACQRSQANYWRSRLPKKICTRIVTKEQVKGYARLLVPRKLLEQVRIGSVCFRHSCSMRTNSKDNLSLAWQQCTSSHSAVGIVCSTPSE